MSRDKKVNVHFSQPNGLKSLSQRLTPLIKSLNPEIKGKC